MKAAKNILITIVLVVIVGIIPIVLYNQTSNTTKVLDKVDGTEMNGASGYFSKIASDPDATQEITNNAANMLDASNKVLKYKNTTYGILVIYLSFAVDILLLIFGIFLKKSVSQSKIGICLICSSILGLLSTGFILISTILNSASV